MADTARRPPADRSNAARPGAPAGSRARGREPPAGVSPAPRGPARRAIAASAAAPPPRPRRCSPAPSAPRAARRCCAPPARPPPPPPLSPRGPARQGRRSIPDRSSDGRAPPGCVALPTGRRRERRRGARRGFPWPVATAPAGHVSAARLLRSPCAAAAPANPRCPWPRAGSRRGSGAPAGGRESPVHPRCSPGRPPDRGTPWPAGLRFSSAAAAAPPCARRPCAAGPAR